MLRRLLILSALILSPAIVSAGGMPNSNSESESSVSNISNSTDTQNQPSSDSSTTTSSKQRNINTFRGHYIFYKKHKRYSYT